MPFNNSRKLPWYKEDPKTGCWNWLRYKAPNGYGRAWDAKAKKVVWAHRYMYEKLVGPILKGLDIDHLCRNRACVNPKHIEPVTRACNIRRGLKTKLNNIDVNEIRKLWKYGKKNQLELGVVFGVGGSQISRIVNNKRWI